MQTRTHVTGTGARRRGVDGVLALVARAACVCAAAIPLLGASPALAAEPGNRNDPAPFLGIWQGNDPLDGGLITLANVVLQLKPPEEE